MSRLPLVLCAPGFLLAGAACSRSPPDGVGDDDPTRGTDPPSAVPSLASVSENALGLGLELYRRGEYDSVRALFLPLLDEARAVFDTASQAKILTLLGMSDWREGDDATARLISEEALDLKLSIGLRDEYSRSYNALGLIAWSQSRLSDALDLYDRMAESVTTDTVYARAAVSINRGLVANDLGDFGTARLAFETGLRLSRQLADAENGQDPRFPRLEGMALSNLGMLEIWTGNPREALHLLAQAEASYQVAGVVDLAANVLGQRGSAYTAMGELGKAIAVLDSAVSLARERGIRDEEASNLEVLAEAYRTAGEYRRALDLYEQAEEINAALGLAQETGSDQRRRAEIYASLGELPLARDYAERALATHRSGDARWEQLSDLILLADVSHEAGDPDVSDTYLAEAKRLAASFDARTARLFTALAEARIADRAAAPRRVLSVLGGVWNDLVSGDYETEWEARDLEARAYHQLGQLDSAAAAGRAAVDAVERVRTSLGSGALRSSYSTERSRASSTLVSILLEQGDPVGAFEVAASAHGRMIVEHPAPGGRGAPAGGDRGGELDETETLLRRIGELTARLREVDALPVADRDDDALRDLSRLLAEARDDYEEARIRAIEGDPGGTAFLGRRRVEATEVQSALRPAEALLHYFVTADVALGFVVRDDRVTSFEIPITEEAIARRIRVVRGLVGSSGAGTGAAHDALRGLHEHLIEPALLNGYLADVERLIVVPHGVLAYVPFSALVGASGRYLVEDFTVQTIPSAAVLPVLRAELPRRGPSVSTAIAFAPLPTSLPATRGEVRAVTDAFSSGWVVEGRRATESRFRQAVTEVDVVHVATHGAMNALNPLFSFIEFQPGTGERGEDDGRLEVHEVLGLSISSSLVFLSGCDTGLGASWSTQFDRGEDYATLALAFLYAGADNVVATLWPVEDEGAAAFAGRFYGELRETDPVEALARAQRELIAHPQYHEPYYWAAYRLSGASVTGPRTTDVSVR